MITWNRAVIQSFLIQRNSEETERRAIMRYVHVPFDPRSGGVLTVSIVLSVSLLSSIAFAQTPPAPVSPPEVMEPPSESPAPPRDPSTGDTPPRDPLSKELRKGEGVLEPPRSVDPGIEKGVPKDFKGKMPIIPPPGEPGGRQDVQPK